MLRKLLKHEFRATSRIMLPLFGLLLLTAVGANFSVGGLLESENSLLSAAGVVLVMGFCIAMAAVCLVAFALMVQRFYKNLLRDEGYVMLTLPVSIHQQIWSKLLVSTVWFAATVLLVILSCCVMAFNIEVLGEVWEGLKLVCRVILEENALGEVASGALVCVEFLIICVLGAFSMCLKFYAAMAVGFSFPNRKVLFSVIAYIGMDIVQALLGGLVINVFNDSAFHYALLGWGDTLSAAAGLHLSMWIVIAAEAVYAAVFYFVTVYFLKKRLNLE